jgi:hypothetical protein
MMSTLEHAPAPTADHPTLADDAAPTTPTPATPVGKTATGTEWREADEIRYRNYQALRQRLREHEGDELVDRGSLMRFAEYVGLPYKYVGHIENRRKPIGRKSAEKLEKAFGLPPGWMDVDRAAGTLVMDDEARRFAELAMRLYLSDRTGVMTALMEYATDQKVQKR